ncbi:MAG: aminotransferase class III-fold pyridoxal phosphate-dependent enzyme, partial [Candidatus Neomarinimicrobiota bacterium]
MTSTVASRPAFTCDEVRAFVRDHYGIDGAVEPLPAERDQNFRLDGGEAGSFVVKIANRSESAEVLDFQNAVLSRLPELWSSGASPRFVKSLSGDLMGTIRGAAGDEFSVRVLTYLQGEPLAAVFPRCERTLDRLGYALGDLDRCLAGFEHPAMERELRWDLRRAEWISKHTGRIRAVRRRGIVERFLLQYRGRSVPLLPDLPMSVIHNDANDENLLLVSDSEDGWRVAGLLDFGDMVLTHTVNELAIACAYVIFGAEEPLAVAARVVAGYHRARPLSEIEIQVLFPLICMRLCVSVTMSAIAAQDDPLNPHAQISDRQAWETLERLAAVDWHEGESRFREACNLHPLTEQQIGHRHWTHGELLEERRRLIGPSLSLLYEVPLFIVRGRGQFLFDDSGQAYLDCVNNVCHVGHCHPKVVAALSAQAETLNTNTRYLHPYLVEYAERLTATLPEPLRVCYFVNSGSEANELAVRLARSHMGRRDVIVLEDGYHGNTTTLVAMSPYKCEGPGGQGLAEWAHKVVKP